MRKISLILLFIVLLAASSAFAQWPDHHLQVFGNAYGIRPGNYKALTRDIRGFVWILYPRYIQRFDGKRITEFPLQGFNHHVYADHKGRIWVSSDTALMRYADDVRGFVSVNIQLKDSHCAIGPVFGLPDGKIYLYSSEGLHHLDTTNQTFGRSMPLQSDQLLHATDLFSTYGMSIFFRAGEYIYAYNLKSRSSRKIKNRNGFRIFALSEDEVLLSTWENNTYRYSFEQGSIIAETLPETYLATSGKTFSVRSIVESKPGQNMVAAREGFFLFDQHKRAFRKLVLYHDGYPVITNDYCQQMHLDGERNLWMLTTDGLARFSLEHEGLGLLRIPQPASQPQGSVNNVRQITEDKSGNLWLATGNGFVKWTKKDGKWIHHSAESGANKRLAHPSIRGIAYDGSNIILGPTNFGSWIYHPGLDRYSRPAYSSDSVRKISERDFIDDITALSNGNYLLLGRDALYLMKMPGYRLSIVAAPASRDNTNRAFERRDGLIWVATQKGLHLLDSSLHHLAKKATGSKDESIWTGYLRKDDSILFPTNDGLYVGSWNGRNIILTKLTSLFDGVFLNCVYEDDRGVIWASSEKGIYRFYPATQELNLLDYTDNIQGFGFNGNGPFRNAEGIVFWGGQNGINYMRPENFSPATESLRVYIQNVRRGEGDSVLHDLSREAELPYESRSLEVELLAPYFNNPDKVKYRYRIDGLDKEWKQLGNNNRLRLTSLPPGRFRLNVQASLDNVHWIDSEQHLFFRVKEPFWLRTWFQVLSTVFLAISVLALIGYRNRKFAAKQALERKMMETRQKIADAEMQALRAQMNPHFIFNCLNSINRYIVKSDQATASLYLTRFAKLIRLILDNSNNQTVSLSNELEALQLYIQMESIRFDKQFTWNIIVDDGVQSDNIHVPPLIIQPYVENAIWHGLLHKENAGHLSVHIRFVKSGFLEVIVEDNGVGRKAAWQLRSKTVSANKSLGMKLTQERLSLLNRNSILHATVEVEDLFTNEGEPGGTRVSLKIPIDKE